MNFIILEKGQNGDNGDISCHSKKGLTNASFGYSQMLYVKLPYFMQRGKQDMDSGVL